MTITAIAKELNTSTMTVYRRLKKSGITIDELRDADTGELTTAGASVIASLFKDTVVTDEDHAQQTAQQDATGVTQHDTIDSQHATNDSSNDIAVLQVRLEAANDTIERLEAERDRLIKQLEAAAAALEREQLDRANERLLLTASSTAHSGQRRRSGFFSWIRRGR